MQDLIDQIVEAVTLYGLDVIGAIIILFVGYILSKRIPKTMISLMNRKSIDPTVSGFLGSLVKFAILAVTVIFVLSQFGVQTTSLVAVFGAAGLAIGLALQGTLSNVAGGVMLLIFRPMKVGNYVEVGGHAGTIKSIDLFTTELATPDNIQIIIPNGAVWGSSISNYSFHNKRRMDIVVGISYDDDIDKARGIIEKVVMANEMSDAEPAPVIEVAELADSSVNFTVRVWCDNANFFPLKFALTKAVKQAFDKEGITIPYPQTVIHKAEDS